MKNLHLLFCITVLSFSILVPSYGTGLDPVKNGPNLNNSSPNDEKMQAMFVFNFLRYIHYKDLPTGNYVILYVGEEEAFEAFKSSIGTRQLNGKNIIVKYSTNPNDVDKSVSIVYVSNAGTKFFDSFKAKISGNSTLLVSEGEGLALKGSHINLVKINGNYKFEVNQKEVNSHGFKISNNLMAMAILIN